MCEEKIGLIKFFYEKKETKKERRKDIDPWLIT